MHLRRKLQIPSDEGIFYSHKDVTCTDCERAEICGQNDDISALGGSCFNFIPESAKTISIGVSRINLGYISTRYV